MQVLLIGANGRSGRPIASGLAQAGIPFKAMVRDASQQDRFLRAGGEVVVADLGRDFQDAFNNVDTVVFTAGSAETEGHASEQMLDRDAIMKAVDHAKQRGIRRFIVISTLLASDPQRAPEALRHYAEMKRESDQHLITSGLDYVVLRPGPLTMAPATGKIAIVDDPSERTPIAREDVAAVTIELLRSGLTRRVIGLTGGEVPIGQALKNL